MKTLTGEKHCYISFREILRSEYRNFEEQRRERQKAECSDYSDLQKELERKFSELFGDDDD